MATDWAHTLLDHILLYDVPVGAPANRHPDAAVRGDMDAVVADITEGLQPHAPEIAKGSAEQSRVDVAVLVEARTVCSSGSRRCRT